MHAVAGYRVKEPFARCIGVHLEGPYINLDCTGAQNPGYVRPPDIGGMRGSPGQQLRPQCRGILVDHLRRDLPLADDVRTMGSAASRARTPRLSSGGANRAPSA